MNGDQSVLFVEDEDLIRELNAGELEEAGYGVVVVENGDGALEALDGNADPFCALVTDINLGTGADGWKSADGLANWMSRCLSSTCPAGAHTTGKPRAYQTACCLENHSPPTSSSRL